MTAKEVQDMILEGARGMGQANQTLGSENMNMGIIQYLVLGGFVVMLIALIIIIKWIMKMVDKQFSDMVFGIKKELDIDDLQSKLIEAMNLARENGEYNRSSINMISESIGLMNVDLHNFRKEISKSFQEKSLEIINKVESGNLSIIELIKETKKFTNEEMHQFIETRFQLSIVNLVDEFCEIVDKNRLFVTKDALYSEINNKIRTQIEKGRTFVESCNFDKKILDVIFEDTDKFIDLAEHMLKEVFNSFYDKGEENIISEDYELLKRAIRGIGDTMRIGAKKSLKKRLLGIERG